jgi:hypothetical protein
MARVPDNFANQVTLMRLARDKYGTSTGQACRTSTQDKFANKLCFVLRFLQVKFANQVRFHM